MKQPTPARLNCPQCQAALLRVQRNFADRCLSLLMPVARYRCAAFRCGWEGLLRRGTPGTGGFRRGGGYLPSQVLEPSRKADVRGSCGA